MKKFAIKKLLKTKSKIIFEADTAEEIKAEAKRLDLREFSKPHIYTHINCEDISGHPYALTQSIILNNNQSLSVSPEDLAKVFNL